ncbi:Serine protease 17 [Operophtera brumata]|uniref:Serine protease 17 n=1 Tax=Operophtera brumata TaxID=104452 RepID=A0A0L7LU60_OPEBR|nr:Serine protease 17 [Operophtera brumata]
MMRLCVVFLLASAAWADSVQVATPTTAYGYLKNYGIPRAEEIRKAEEQLAQSKIIGGLPAALGQYPFQAGLIGDIIGLEGRAVCGGSLITANKVVTAAHCWNDGIHQVWRLTVVLGSTLIFSGGTRVESSVVASHPNWNPLLARNDVAVIYLPNPVLFSNLIGPVALPTGSEIFEGFVGEPAIAVGFGITRDGASISPDQSLNHVRLNVITNSLCNIGFPLIIQPSHICTSGLGGVSTCSGDSGGPLLASRDGRPVLIGVASFVSALGCESNLPAVFARITSYLDFISSHLTFVTAALFALASFACADESRQVISGNAAYGYLANIGIPEAERIRQAEEKGEVSRIVGGVPASLGQYPYQAGLLISIIGFDGNGVCGGSLISGNRVITAAHCWFDGVNQAWRITVVLGSAFLFSGGTRVDTSVVATHPSWFPALIRNDVAVIYLPNNISPISLPSGPEINEDFAVASAASEPAVVTLVVLLSVLCPSAQVLAASLINLSCGHNASQFSEWNNKALGHNAYGYLKNIGIPEAERVYKEEHFSYLMPRIVGGDTADIAGLIVSIANLTGFGLCGGSLISANRVATAAHCWFDGIHQGTCVTVVLGSAEVFSGGTRIKSCEVYTHLGWDPVKAANDVAVIYLHSPVIFSDIPVPDDQVLSKVGLTVISNEECSPTYPQIIRPSIICTSGNVNCRFYYIPLSFTMKVLLVLTLAALVHARSVEEAPRTSAPGYIQNIAIPLAEEIEKAEATITQNRIIGLSGRGVCGGSLVSANRVITAAHCWFDGVDQAYRVEVVLGSITLFFGGTRIESRNVIMHPDYVPSLARNDVTVIYLPSSVLFTSTISPISLPSGAELLENYAGETAVASGFGWTSQNGGIGVNQVLSYVRLNVITNNVCFLAFPLFLQNSNICTSSIGNVSTCRGDSGGPLAVVRNNRPIVVGITSFGSGLGCEAGMPAAFARVTSFIDFFNQHI